MFYNVIKLDGLGELIGFLMLWSFIDEVFIEILMFGFVEDIGYYEGEEV